MTDATLYLTRTDEVGEAELARYEHWLDESERKRYRRPARPEAQRRFLLGRALLRERLGRALGIEPGAVVLRHSAEGKPHLGEAGPEFNLSHSGHWVALALSHAGPVGLDLEQPRKPRPLQAIARHYFHPDEARALEALEGSALETGFYRLWTLKEAYLKALGTGLAGGLDRLYFPDAGSEPHSAPEDGHWQLHHWRLPPEPGGAAYLSLALQDRDPVPVHLVEGVPGGPWRPARIGSS